MGCCHRRDHRRCCDRQRSCCINRRSGRSSSRRVKRQDCPGESSCAVRAAAARRLSLCAVGGQAGVLLQPLHRTRLRSSQRAARWTYSRRRYGSAVPQAIGRNTAAWRPVGAARRLCQHFSAGWLAACPQSLALRRSFLTIPATLDDSFRPVICASRQIPCENRCSARSARDRASRLDF
jgi:hypothetical protein